MIVIIWFLVSIYSYEYMQHDPNIVRFLAFLSLFCFFMLLLVSAGNFVLLFMGWEGVGLCSFLLIGFWSSRNEAVAGALKALFFNKVGDFSLFLAILSIFLNFGTFDIALVNSLVWFLESDVSILFISFFVLVGALTKSGQLPFSVWLLSAMEGPTPVSALLHAATMVTAGVYLVIRCCDIFEISSLSVFLLVLVGGLSAL